MTIKLNTSKLRAKILSKQQSEKNILEYKIFYKTHFLRIKQRDEILKKLYNICERYKKTQPDSFYIDEDKKQLESEIQHFFSEYFTENILRLYNKKIPLPKIQKGVDFDKPFWLELLVSFSNTFEAFDEKYKQVWNYKLNFLRFLYSCLYYYGLHPDILNRDRNIYNRYNFVLEHNFKSNINVKEYKTLLTPELLQREFLSPYENRLPIKINGKLIPFDDIYSIQITSTILLDDEIELFGEKNNFTWNDTIKDEIEFISFCKNETDNILKNPYLIDNTSLYKNQKTYFVSIDRIEELKVINNDSFDLIKLIRLCEELNSASSLNNNFSSSLLVRSIIDHIPPIFDFESFKQFANNYTEGTRSFKKSMLNLENSLRNIADNNIHSQVRKKEVLPTTIQIDFTQELDLLLSEIVRKLK